MKLTVEHTVFDGNGSLKLMPDERLLAKKKLLCWIYQKGLLLKKSSAPATIFYTDSGFIYRTNQRIICTKIPDEGIVEDEVCIEVPLDEIMVLKRSLFWSTLDCRELKGDRYFIEFSPRKSSKKFLDEVIKIDRRRKFEREKSTLKQSN